MDLMLGRIIGGVTLESKLGAGGMAAVYAGKDAEDGGARRALKVLSVASPENIQVRFEREARIGKGLAHPLIVRVHRHGTSGDYRYMVMDLVEGEDLARLLRKNGPLHWTVVCTLGRDIALALGHAHQSGIVHRDVKPQNVLVDPQWKIKLADFGLAHWRDGPPDLAHGAQLTATGDAFGTPAYMAPEQFRDAKSAGPAADLYSLGILLFEGLAGRVPFHASSPVDLARLHRDVPPPSLEALAAEAPDRLRDLIMRLLEKDHLRRPASANDVARELEDIAARGPTSTNISDLPDRLKSGSGASRLGAGDLPPRRRRVRPVVLLALAALGALLGWGLHTGKLQRRVRLYVLAAPEERARYEALRAARENVATDGRSLVEAFAAYLRDFGDDGWLAGDVRSFRERPVLRGGNTYLMIPDNAEMAYVPSGTYKIGAPDGDDRAATAPRDVRLAGFLIDKLEVSNERYDRFLAEWQARGSEHLCGKSDADHAAALARSTNALTGRSPYPDGPIVGVTPWDALEYARFYGRRLPSEEEWEVAASWDPTKGAQRAFPWGAEAPSPESSGLANLSFAGFGGPGPNGFLALCSQPGFFAFDVSPLGLLDAGGNAAEWCTGDKPLPGKQPLRGGSILSATSASARPVARREYDPKEPPEDAGFRTVMPYEADAP